MSVTEQDWQNEQQRVERVVREIRNRIGSLEQRVGEVKEEIVEIRKNFWDDVTVNFEDTAEVMETFASMRQQQHVLSERERSHKHAVEQLRTLLRLRKTPYFGRIDFVENGEAHVEQIYLGIGTVLDETEEGFLVYDWRAPVSSLYYDYPPGPAEYETPSGTIEGTMELKRQFVIRDGKILSLFDTGVTIGDELLQAVLGRHSDNQMKSIVATIQKEQNRIIRNTQSRLLIVQGAAGSGKTSAALQRVAYLLYRFRETLSADQIVLFSPNPMFNSYISTVLPELGEENMEQTTFIDYIHHRLSRMFDLENPFTQMEYALTAMEEPGYEARMQGIRYKSGTGFMDVIDGYIEALGREGMIFKNVRFRGEVVISASAVREHFYGIEATSKIPNRIKLLVDWMLGELEAYAREEMKKPWVEEEIELLEKEDYAKSFSKMSREKRSARGEEIDEYDREREMLAEMVVRRQFKSLRKGIRRLRFIDIPSLYRKLFADPQAVARFAPDVQLPERWTEICELTAARLEQGEMAYEDATPYLYLQDRIEGFQTNTSIRHVFIDEAQDYTPFQFAFLRRVFPRSKMTVLGDLNQSIYAHSTAETNFAALADTYKEDETEMIVLRRSYRSTRPIVEFTSQMIPGGEEIEPFNREGKKPTVTRVEDRAQLHAEIAERIRELQEEGHQTIAVICKTAQESQQAYDGLQERVPLRLIGQETATFESGTLVIPAYLAKGVEFDAVILYNGSKEQYGRESERKLFYTACTRAMHELHVYAVGELSPFLSGVSLETYI
ncbi:MAG: RNA polymerase recycling motor HelD [Tumebacillaceae bacterium]